VDPTYRNSRPSLLAQKALCARCGKSGGEGRRTGGSDQVGTSAGSMLPKRAPFHPMSGALREDDGRAVVPLGSCGGTRGVPNSPGIAEDGRAT
jgi:hypothetical protein